MGVDMEENKGNHSSKMQGNYLFIFQNIVDAKLLLVILSNFPLGNMEEILDKEDIEFNKLLSQEEILNDIYEHVEFFEENKVNHHFSNISLLFNQNCCLVEKFFSLH